MGVFDQNELDDAAAQAAASEQPEATGNTVAAEDPAPELAPEAEKTAEPAAKPVQAPAKQAAKPKAEKPATKHDEEAAETAPAPKAEKSSKATYKEGVKPSLEQVKTPADMRDYLMSFPKVKTLIPLMPGEKPGTTEIIAINGVQLNVKKGVMVDLPKPFAELVFAHYNISLENGTIGAEKRIDGNRDKEFALA